MKKFILPFLFSIIIINLYALPFVLPNPTSPNSLNYGILDEGKCLKNKEIMIGGYFNTILSPLLFTLDINSGFYYRLGLLTSFEFSFKTGISMPIGLFSYLGYWMKSATYQAIDIYYLPININLSIKKEFFKKRILLFLIN